MKTINWGIIGAGNISKSFAIALNSLDDTNIVAVAARDLTRAQVFANEFHITKAYASYEELVEDPEIDVVYIGTTNTEHKANAMLCIEHGKAVLCEKPFTLNRTEASLLISSAAKYNVFLMEAMWTKFLPTTKKVKEWIDENRIGELRNLRINFGVQREIDTKSRLFNPDVAGGALLDIGIYPITYALHMIQQIPDNITSCAIIGKSTVDEQNTILFQYNNGIIANLSSAFTADLGKEAIIIGDKGKIRVPDFWMAQSAELYTYDGKLIELYNEPFHANGYEYEAEEVNQCLRQGKTESSIVPLKDTLDRMAILDQIRSQWGLRYPKEI